MGVRLGGGPREQVRWLFLIVGADDEKRLGLFHVGSTTTPPPSDRLVGWISAVGWRRAIGRDQGLRIDQVGRMDAGGGSQRERGDPRETRRILGRRRNGFVRGLLVGGRTPGAFGFIHTARVSWLSRCALAR
ncbi:unnamed protein product [Laminaria digitata]